MLSNKKQELLTELFGGSKVPLTSDIIPNDLHEYLSTQPKKIMTYRVGGGKYDLRTDAGRLGYRDKLEQLMEMTLKANKHIEIIVSTDVLDAKIKKLMKGIVKGQEKSIKKFKQDKMIPVYPLYDDIELVYNPKDKNLYTLLVTNYGDLYIVAFFLYIKEPVKILEEETTISDKNCVINYQKWLKESEYKPYDIMRASLKKNMKSKMNVQMKSSVISKIAGKLKNIFSVFKTKNQKD